MHEPTPIENAVRAAWAARLTAAGCIAAMDELGLLERHLKPDEIDAAIDHRAEGWPIELAAGVAEFGGVDVKVERGVFIPRRRAERLVEVAARLKPGAGVVVDLGCGAGAVAAALAARLPTADIYACDNSPAAVALARANAPTATVCCGEWWDALPAKLAGHVDLAVGYLPHVPSAHLGKIHPDYRAVEPAATVDGGADGLDHVRAVAAGLDQWLAPDGIFLTLVSPWQAEALATTLGARIVEQDDYDAVIELSRRS